MPESLMVRSELLVGLFTGSLLMSRMVQLIMTRYWAHTSNNEEEVINALMKSGPGGLKFGRASHRRLHTGVRSVLVGWGMLVGAPRSRRRSRSRSRR